MTEYNIEYIRNGCVIVAIMAAVTVAVFPMADCTKHMSDNDNKVFVACAQAASCRTGSGDHITLTVGK